MFSLTCCKNACRNCTVSPLTSPCVPDLPWRRSLWLCCWPRWPHCGVSVSSAPTSRPGYECSVATGTPAALPLVPPLCLCHMFQMPPQVIALIVAALLRPCLQSDVGVGHLPTDYSGVHSSRSLGGSLPYTAGLGQTVAGQHTLLLHRPQPQAICLWA